MGKNNYQDDFIENELYHVYSRTNNKELLFLHDENRSFFLNQFDLYCSPFLETYSWNLLPDHFHFLVKVKSYETILEYLENKPAQDRCTTENKFLQKKTTIHDLTDNAFRRFFISYTMPFNSLHGRKGNLVHRPFKHVRVIIGSQFTQTIMYIHANAFKHKRVDDFTKHKWPSYHTILGNKPTKLPRDELPDRFGGREQFIKILKALTEYDYSCGTNFDDD